MWDCVLKGLLKDDPRSGRQTHLDAVTCISQAQIFKERYDCVVITFELIKPVNKQTNIHRLARFADEQAEGFDELLDCPVNLQLDTFLCGHI